MRIVCLSREAKKQGLVCLLILDIKVNEFQKILLVWFQPDLTKNLQVSDCGDLCCFLEMKVSKKNNYFRTNLVQYIEVVRNI